MEPGDKVSLFLQSFDMKLLLDGSMIFINCLKLRQYMLLQSPASSSTCRVCVSGV